MCGIAEGLLAVATLASAGGAIAQGQSGAAMANYNAKVAEQNAVTERQLGVLEEFRVRDDVRRALSGLQADNAASGFQLTGTPLLIAAESAKAGELDALTARFGRQQRAHGYEAQAQLDRASGAAKQQAGLFGAASYLLSGGSRVAEMRGW